MRKLLTVILFFLAFLLQINTSAASNNLIPSQKYYQGVVLKVLENGYKTIDGSKQPYQKLDIKIINGDLNGKQIQVENGGSISITEGQRVNQGDKVVLTSVSTPIGNTFIITDRYRIGPVIFLILLFIAIAVITAGKRGITSIIGLFVGVFIITNFMVPQILAGSNPAIISYIAVLLIAVSSLYLAHGFNRNTSLALISTLITLLVSMVLSGIAVNITHLSGAGTDESFFLSANQTISVNLKGLLLGGIILGVLGVLDDITTAQTSVVSEIKGANPRLNLFELYSKGINVGKEHITSLINTLFLAYAGASLPLFLLLKLNSYQPLWVTFNSEFIIEEVVRTLVGSIALILAVPLSTFIAAYYYENKKVSVHDGHHH
ncbi:MAG TPA: YibE/F family protein [Candidatus Saccharimonadales bacterium]|nr:YibE/F family protein [Candidatus Saccharimonadales bacterium]